MYIFNDVMCELKELYNGKICSKMNIMYLKFKVMIIENMLLLCE